MLTLMGRALSFCRPPVAAQPNGPVRAALKDSPSSTAAGGAWPRLNPWGGLLDRGAAMKDERRASTPQVATWIRLATPQSVVGDGKSQWQIALDDGRVVPLDVTVLLGRNPQRRPQDPVAQLVPASGDGRTIDRTHVMIGTDSLGVFVIDRDSSTGTAVQLPDGSLEEIRAERKVYMRDGQCVVYGERWFVVEKVDAR